jgi:hypothetical protein
MSIETIEFLAGFFSALFSGAAILRMMPPPSFKWGRYLHILISLSQFYVAAIYYLVIAGVLLPSTYAAYVYPAGVLILSPGWVVWLTSKFTRRAHG